MKINIDPQSLIGKKILVKTRPKEAQIQNVIDVSMDGKWYKHGEEDHKWLSYKKLKTKDIIQIMPDPIDPEQHMTASEIVTHRKKAKS